MCQGPQAFWEISSVGKILPVLPALPKTKFKHPELAFFLIRGILVIYNMSKAGYQENSKTTENSSD